MMRLIPGIRLIPAALLISAMLACGSNEIPGIEVPRDDDPKGSDSVRVALTDMGARLYKGFAGGLYPGASNSMPADHLSAGRAAAALIVPRSRNGTPAPQGRYVLLSIGMSNTTQEFCAQSGTQCDAWTFAGQANADPAVNHTTLAIVNGAQGGQTASTWDSPADANYNMIRDQRLAPLGLGEQQVQIVWMKVANAQPRIALPAGDADAYSLQRQMGDIVRTLKARYPNLQQVFVSSRIYAGYATTALNPEPYAYESGFAVKWLIESQITQMRGGAADARSGNLAYPAIAPWTAWGPYLWADGRNARSDGLIWEPMDFQGDGTHPSQSGERKVGTMLLEFFKTSPVTSCWFLAGQAC